VALMELIKHETCQQYVSRRLSEGWKVIWHSGYYLVLSSPDGNILRPVDLRNDVETLRPSAPGDETSIESQFPDSTFHWDKVDEASTDEDETYVINDFSEVSIYQRDLYSLPASSGSGTINKITVHFRCRCESSTTGIGYKASIKSNTTVTDGAEKTPSAGNTWEPFSQEWAVNPAPPGTDAWTWDDIDALQIGVNLKSRSVEDTYARCTQVYVEVDYTPPPGWTGKISGVTNPAKIMGVAAANIAKVKGVA